MAIVDTDHLIHSLFPIVTFSVPHFSNVECDMERFCIQKCAKRSFLKRPFGYNDREKKIVGGPLMEIRFYNDPETGQPHIFGHGVTEDEVRQVMRASGNDYPAARGSRMKLRKTLCRTLPASGLCAR